MMEERLLHGTRRVTWDTTSLMHVVALATRDPRVIVTGCGELVAFRDVFLPADLAKPRCARCWGDWSALAIMVALRRHWGLWRGRPA